MKFVKTAVAVVMCSFIYMGTASAVFVNDLNVSTIFGSGTVFGGGGATINQDTAYNDWFGLIIADTLPGGGAVDSQVGGSQSIQVLGTAISTINIWEADQGANNGLSSPDSGSEWTKILSSGDPYATQSPAAAATPLFVTLFAGKKYLLETVGTLKYLGAGGEFEEATYGWQLRSTVVPVPAAVWLFGTAMIGLIGLRRKAKLGSATA